MALLSFLCQALIQALTPAGVENEQMAFFASIKTFAIVSLLINKGSLPRKKRYACLSFFRKKAR